MENKLESSMFGSFTLKYGGKTMTLGRSTTAKSVQLLQYLLIRGDEGVEKQQLAQMFYDWENVSDANNSLNSLLYRLKSYLFAAGMPKEEYIEIKNGICRWKSNVPVWIDVTEFENCVKSSENAVGEEKRKYLEEAVKLYKGELLPHLANELWVIMESVRLKKLYVFCVQQLGELMREKREYENMYELFKDAAEIYPYDEWQEKQIDALYYLKRYEEAFKLHRETSRLYREELGMPISKNMSDLYQQLNGRHENEIYDSNTIQTALCENEWKNGAFCCGYPSFVNMYRLMCRIVQRSGQLICLMVCTLYYENADYVADQEVENCLRMAIDKSLRRGDICTRYSWNQYLLLVPVTQKENCDLIFGRIEKFFDMFNTKKECRVKYEAAEAVDPSVLGRAHEYMKK